MTTDKTTDTPETEPAPPAPGSGLRRGLALGLAALLVVALVVVALEVVLLRPKADAAAQERQDRADVVRVAQTFSAQMNTYDATSSGGLATYRKNVTGMLSPKFKADYAKAMEQIVNAVEQAQVVSKGDVLSSAVASMDSDSAQVLVVSDASVKSTVSPNGLARHFRWEVSLVKIDGRWLVDNFSPVA